MVSEITRVEFELQSSNRTNILHGFTWKPEGPARATFQLVHGMSEHVERYDEFARFLAAHGFMVAGHDQLGHGLSASVAERGVLSAANGKDELLADIDLVRRHLMDRAPTGVPYFIFGHSMGSFSTRCYIARKGAGIAGAIICGTGSVPPALSRAGNFLARAISRTRGETYVSKLLDNMGVGAYAKAIKDAQTPYDWLSHNRENVERYIADELCGFPFAAGGYATLTSLTKDACSIHTAALVPATLPLLFIAGAEDPVGDFGEGVRKAAELARSAGSMDVTCTIYENMRHEILNEDGRDKVMGDVLAWAEAHLGSARKDA